MLKYIVLIASCSALTTSSSGNSGYNFDSFINNMMGSANSKTYTTTTTTTKPYITTTTAKTYTTTATTFKTAVVAQANYIATQTKATAITATRPTTTVTSAPPSYIANMKYIASEPATTTTTTSSNPAYTTSQSSLTQNSFDIQQMACLVNYQRKLKGAAPLTISSGINKIALGHSIWQAQTNNMTHYGANGSTLINRFDSANYPSKYVAENVAWNQRSSAEVVQAWVNSPGHYANMINPSYTEFGCTSVNWYWTFDFGSSSGVGNTIPNCSGYQIP